MSRITKTFATLKKKKRAALITYIMAYDPSRAVCEKILQALPEAGADIIELGMPFSDPMAEGPTIQEAAKRALKVGSTMKGVLQILSNFRKKDQKTPVILMGYFNPILHYGVQNFVRDAKAAGADGCIIVDLPPEEEKEFTVFAYKSGLDLIKLSAPTTDKERAKVIYKNARGFAYYVSITGITGTKTADFEEVKKHLKVIRSSTKLPIAVGFGIKTPEQVAEVAKFADGVVVGSAIVNLIGKNRARAVKPVTNLVNRLSQALKK